ncbi:hypothetical protein [Spirulina sp. 06S082]|uniref:hypothetical protein n=1 Tax=Spirulina sp. 06S082 TaxID=3110248 RepID=UPI002B1F44FA|nr:hypothetical protein [Spirulina sp. 06S082]MEA5472355.1 hypothetical protein [Spirulina sp. 06S082]
MKMIRVKKQHGFNVQIMGGILASFGIIIYSALRPIPAIAQINQAIVQEIVKSDENAEENGVFIDEDLAEVDAIALLKQKIVTQAASTSLLFSNGAMGRLGPQSSVIVGQCIEVQQGLLLASGPANGCTATFEIGVEGTVYVMEVNAAGETQIKVLEGELKVKLTKEESETTEETPQEIAIKAGEKIAITPSGLFGQVAELLQSDVENILNGALFKGFNSPLLGTSALQESLENLYPDIDIPRLPRFGIPTTPPRPRLPF